MSDYNDILTDAIQAYQHERLANIGSGTTRHVYEFGKYVLKVGSPWANNEEYYRYEYEVAIDRDKHFATVYAINGRYLLMEKVNNCFDLEAHDLWHEGQLKINDSIEYLMELFDDPCLFNVGKRIDTGEFVILDFAC